MQEEVTRTMHLKKPNRGQSLTEYAIILSVVASALIGISLFVNRGLKAKAKDVTDYLTTQTGDAAGTGVQLGKTSQYEPYYATSNLASSQSHTATEAVQEGYKTDTTGINDSSGRTGTQTQGTDLTKDNAWQ